MHWFIDPIKNHYADFDGRVGRQEFWMFVLFNCGLSIIFEVMGLETLSMLVSLALLIPSLALGARRLHDTNRSGWWQLLGLIPIFGWVILIIWMATKTDDQDNEYGKPAVPKTGPENSTSVASMSVPETQTMTTETSDTPDNGNTKSE